MRRILLVLSGILTGGILVMFLLFFVPQKSDNELIEARINSFVTAYNDGNMDAVMECLDSNTRNTYKVIMNTGLSIGGNVLKSVKTNLNINLSDLFGISINTVSEKDILSLSELNINILSDAEAFAETELSYEDNLTEHSEKICFTMVKENDNWFIKNLENK